MGWFDGRRTMCFSLPKEQVKMLDYLFEAALAKNKNFDPNIWAEKLIGNWLDSHFRNTIEEMAYIDRKRRKKRS
jgi:hypothetical protein